MASAAPKIPFNRGRMAVFMEIVRAPVAEGNFFGENLQRKLGVL
jgi:hypothetical protein